MHEQDSFTRCFKSNSPEPWNWNIYLFPLWCCGVVFRYFILFPVRLDIVLFYLYMLNYFTLCSIVSRGQVSSVNYSTTSIVKLVFLSAIESTGFLVSSISWIIYLFSNIYRIILFSKAIAVYSSAIELDL